jgi:16S rRNA G527 N7-methylase RsmG
LRPGEEEELLSRYTVASNGRRLLELCNQALDRLADAEDAALKHYLDCAIPLLHASREGALEAGEAPPVAFADIGAGGGFPGLVAALVWPTAKATLVEPARKRQSFLQVAASAMGRCSCEAGVNGLRSGPA